MKKSGKTLRFLPVILLCATQLYVGRMQAKPVGALTQYSKAECVMELNSRRIVYEQNGDIRLPMASTTKIVTCATVLERCAHLDEQIVIPKQAENVEGSSVYLKAGDSYSVEDLLYGLMLRSGNDCATALALHFGGSVGGFCAQMNAYAQKAGALNTCFANPHGLPNKKHYTTAVDLTAITCFALQNPTFQRIVSTLYYQPRGWKNKNKLLTSFEGAIGVKTGFTKEAGRCLVSAATRGNTTFVCTVLHCPTMYERSAQLLNDAFSLYENTEIISKGERLKIQTQKGEIEGAVKESYFYPLLAEEKDYLQIKTRPLSTEEGLLGEEFVGKFEIYLSNRLLFSSFLYKL